MAGKNKDASLNKRAFTSGFFFILAQLFARGLTFAVTPIYSRLLTQAQYGIVRTYESWLLIAYTIMSLCLWRSVDVAKNDFEEDYNGYVSSVHTLSYIAIAFFFGICMIFKTQVQDFCQMDDLMFYSCFLYVFTYTSMLYVQRRDKQVLKYKFSTMATLLTIVPGTFLSIWLIYRGRVQGLVDQLVDRRVIGYYVPQIIGGAIVAIVIWTQSDKIMIQKMISNEAAGIFALATTISFIIWILEDSVWNAWIPWLYAKISQGEEKEVAKPWTSVMHMFGILSWVIVMLAPEAIAILGPAKYRPAVWLIAPMVSGTLFRFYSYSYSALQNYYKKTQYVAAGTIGTMVLNVLLNYVCILNFGYMAAAYTTAFSYIILLLVQGILEHKITGMVIVPLRKTFLIAVVYGAINLLSMNLYKTAWYFRYAVLILVVVAAAIALRKQMAAVLKMFKKRK